MTIINGKAEKIATSIGWAALHRLVTVIGVPISLAALGWLMLQVAGIDAIVADINGRFNAMDIRFEERKVEVDRRLDTIEQIGRQLAERQGARVPLFDSMVIEFKEHENRIRALEQRR